MKKLLKFEGIEKLSKSQLLEINGGGPIKAICPPEPPVCSDGDLDCERRLEYYNVYCVNG